MSLKNLFTNIARLARADGVTTFTAGDITAIQASLNSTSGKLSVEGSSRPAENVIMAFACIQCRRDAIGGQTPMLTQGEDVPLEDGPAKELLDRPNAAMDWDQFVRALETHQTLHNVCAVHVLPDPVRPELTPLQPEGLQAVPGVHTPTGTPRIVRWHYIDPTTAEQREFEADEVVIRMGYNPHAPLSSLSPIRVLDRTIKGDLAAREQNLGLFQNDATPKGYLHTDQGMTRDQALQALDVWNSAHQGFLNRHKTAALWGGLKYDRIQLSPAELEFMASLRQMRIDYYMAFRVYPAMLAEMTGETGLSQGSSTETQRIAWWEDIGLSELKLLAGLVTECFQRLSLPGTVWFNSAQIPALARQRLGKTDTAAKLLTAGYRPDDVNDYLDLGLPAHPDNVARIPFSLQEIGAAAEKRGTTDGTDGADAGKEKPQENAKEELQPARSGMLAAVDRLEEILCRAGKGERGGDPAFAKRIAALEKNAARKWSRFFIEQRGRVLKRLNGMAENKALARAANEAVSLAFSAFPKADEDMLLVARINPVIVETLKSGWQEFGAKTGIDNPFAVEDPNIQKAIAARQIQATKVNDTTEEDLRRLFSEGFEAGDTIGQLADRVAGYYAERCEGHDSDRALNAAETQTTGIVNDAQLLAAREAGGLRKFWIHAPPGLGDDRETHLAAAKTYSQGQAIALDAKFRVGGEDMDAPGDPQASPGNVCRCRCQLGFVKEEKP